MTNQKQSPVFLSHNDLKKKETAPGLTVRIMGYNRQIMMMEARFKQGAEGYAHSHPHVQTSYISSGKFEVTVGGAKKILEAGDGFFVPPEVVHGVLCLEAGIIIDAFHPAREDLLEQMLAEE